MKRKKALCRKAWSQEDVEGVWRGGRGCWKSDQLLSDEELVGQVYEGRKGSGTREEEPETRALANTSRDGAPAVAMLEACAQLEL